MPWHFSLWKVSRSKGTNSPKCHWVLPSDVLTAAPDTDCWTVVIPECPLFTSHPCCHSPQQQQILGGMPVPCFEDNLSHHDSLSDIMWTMSLTFFSFSNKILLFIRFFILHGVLKYCLWTSCMSLLGHLVLLLQIAHVKATFEAQGFRHDNRALIRLAICLGFVSSFVHFLSGFQCLFSVF